MGFLAVLFALVIEQARPLARGNWIHAAFRAWARWSGRSLDAGKTHHAWLAWFVAVMGPAVATLAIHVLLLQVSVLLAFVWSVGILYVTLGFRQFSHYFTDIRDALDDGDEGTARALLAQWRQVDASELPRSEIVRNVIEHSVLAAHRHVFGVLCWFSISAALGLGPTGAVLYRLGEFVARYWVHKSKSPTAGEGVSPALQTIATTVWGVIDYLPARMTSLGFAVVGSFEDAIDAWRSHNFRAPAKTVAALGFHNDALILAATSGAVNVRLGGELSAPALAPAAPPEAAGTNNFDGSLRSNHPPAAEPAMPGRLPEVAHLRSVVGLVWRSVVLWMVLLALLTLARLLG